MVQIIFLKVTKNRPFIFIFFVVHLRIINLKCLFIFLMILICCIFLVKTFLPIQIHYELISFILIIFKRLSHSFLCSFGLIFDEIHYQCSVFLSIHLIIVLISPALIAIFLVFLIGKIYLGLIKIFSRIFDSMVFDLIFSKIIVVGKCILYFIYIQLIISNFYSLDELI